MDSMRGDIYEYYKDLVVDTRTAAQLKSEAEFLSLYNKSSEMLEALRDLNFASEGFSPRKTIKLMLNAYKKNPSGAFFLAADGTVYDFKEETSFDELVEASVLLFVTRRTHVKRLSALYDYLNARLGINFSKTKHQMMGVEMITLTRVASCFPTLPVDFCKRGIGKALYTTDQMGFPIGSDAAGYFLSSFIAGLIPHKVYSEMINMRYLVLLSYVLSHIARHNFDVNSRAILPDISRIFRFMKLAAGSRMPKEVLRNAFMIKRGLMNEQGVVHNDIVVTAAGAKSRIQLALPNDPTWAQVVKEIENSHTCCW